MSTVEYTIKHGSIINHTLFLVVYRPRTPPPPPGLGSSYFSVYLSFFPFLILASSSVYGDGICRDSHSFFGQVSSSSVKSAAWAVVEALVRERSDRCSIH